ncbi:MAG: hypothetical protein ABGW69_02425 [Nanoarchaeota archaeon]
MLFKKIKNYYEHYSKSDLTKVSFYFGLLLSSYYQIYEKFFRKLFNDSFLTPYINSDDPNTIRHTLEHILRSHGNDFVGSLALAGLTYYVTKPLTGEKYATISSVLSSFPLVSLELAQKYHLISGVYDKGDLITYFIGVLAFPIGRTLYSRYKEKKINKK